MNYLLSVLTALGALILLGTLIFLMEITEKRVGEAFLDTFAPQMGNPESARLTPMAKQKEPTINRDADPISSWEDEGGAAACGDQSTCKQHEDLSAESQKVGNRVDMKESRANASINNKSALAQLTSVLSSRISLAARMLRVPRR